MESVLVLQLVFVSCTRQEIPLCSKDCRKSGAFTISSQKPPAVCPVTVGHGVCDCVAHNTSLDQITASESFLLGLNYPELSFARSK